MTVVLDTFELRTKSYCDVINISQQVQNAINNSGIKNGIVNVHVAGSTGAISTTEYEPGLVQHDIEELFESIIPYKKNYKHHNTWGDHNGAGHLRSFLIKTSHCWLRFHVVRDKDKHRITFELIPFNNFLRCP